MASRKEEQKQRRREERLAAEREAQAMARRRLMAGYFVAAILGVALVAGLLVALAGGGGDGGFDHLPAAARIDPLSGALDDVKPDGREGTPPPAPKIADLSDAAEKAGCELQLDLEDEGNGHFTDENTQVNYGTDPPTSGDHYGVPTETAAGAQADGAYAETPETSRFVHSLEHGRIEIQYASSLKRADQLELKGVFDDDPAKVLLFPNDEMPFKVATTAWTQLMGCKAYEGAATLDAIRAFRDTYRDQGPESF